jgi:hypothetical protein
MAGNYNITPAEALAASNAIDTFGGDFRTTIGKLEADLAGVNNEQAGSFKGSIDTANTQLDQLSVLVSQTLAEMGQLVNGAVGSIESTTADSTKQVDNVISAGEAIRPI